MIIPTDKMDPVSKDLRVERDPEDDYQPPVSEPSTGFSGDEATSHESSLCLHEPADGTPPGVGMRNSCLPWSDTDETILRHVYPMVPKGCLQKMFDLFTRHGFRSVCRRAQELGIATRRRTYWVHEGFFDAWSEPMAYVLGLIAADGNIQSKAHGGARNYFTIYSKDKDLLESINAAMSNEQPLFIRIYDWKGELHAMYHLHVNSSRMVKRLLDFGITPRKSLTLELPDVPYEFFPHFVRGYFDGNGWASILKRWNTFRAGLMGGSQKLIEALEEKLRSSLGFRPKKVCKPKEVMAFHFQYQGDEAYRFCNWLYQAASIYLKRKRDVFERHKRLSEGESDAATL